MTIIHTQKFRSNRNQAWHTQAAAAVTGSSPAMAIMPLLAKKITPWWCHLAAAEQAEWWAFVSGADYNAATARRHSIGMAARRGAMALNGRRRQPRLKFECNIST